MDFSEIFNQLISKLWFIFPLLIILSIIKLPQFKGWVGELFINVSSKFLLDKNQYHLIKNVTLPTDDATTQIDHIFLSVFGIFVVETKNMKGWIFGSEHQKTWTQKIYRYTHKFQNPLHQNYKHVKTLQALLGLDEQQIHSVVVFVGKSTFKTEMPENVTYGGGYARYIKSKTVPVFSDIQVQEIKKNIETLRLAPTFKTHFQHVAHVDSIVAKKENSPIVICPRCGSSMLLRETKRGPQAGKKFWGCATFPKCRGVVPATPSNRERTTNGY